MSDAAGATVAGIFSLLGGMMNNSANARAQSNANQNNANLMYQAQNFDAASANTQRDWASEQARVSREFDAGQTQQAQDFNSRMLDKQAFYDSQFQRDQMNFENTAAATARDWTGGQLSRVMQFNSAEAQRQMDFQTSSIANQQAYETQMSNTAYQRMRADMLKAGLNPILGISSGGSSTPSISAGSGAAGSVSAPSTQIPSVGMPSVGLPSGTAAHASIPSGASAHSQLAQMKAPTFQDFISPAVSNALSAYRGSVSAREADASIALQNAQTANQAAQGGLIQAQTRSTDARTALDLAEADLKPSQRSEIEARTRASESVPAMNAAIAQSNTAAAASSLQNASTARASQGQIEKATEMLDRYGPPGHGTIVDGLIYGERTGRALLPQLLPQLGQGSQSGNYFPNFKMPSFSLPRSGEGLSTTTSPLQY